MATISAPDTVHPSRWFYGLAALAALLGIAGFVWILWSNLKGIGNSLPQFIMPGTAELSLTQPGTYTIFYEPNSVVGNRIFSSGERMPGLKCVVTPEASGANLELRQPAMSETYTMGGRSGTSVFEFAVQNPGKFQLTCLYPGEAREPEAVLAVGHNFIGHIFATVGLGLASMFGGLGFGALVFSITLARRRRSLSRLRPSAAALPHE